MSGRPADDDPATARTRRNRRKADLAFIARLRAHIADGNYAALYAERARMPKKPLWRIAAIEHAMARAAAVASADAPSSEA